MRIITYVKVVLLVLALSLAGCGGGGGGGGTDPPTTKTATLKFYSQSTNPSDLIGGFLLTVILPSGTILPTDASGIPLSNAVYLSGQFSGAIPQIIGYDSALRKLTVNYASSNSYQLGEFITIIVTVPATYVPNVSGISYSYEAFAPLTGVRLLNVSATPTFN